LRWRANFIWTLKRGVGIAAKSRKRPSAKKPQPGQERFDGAPSRFSDDITNKKQIHAGDFSANPGKNTQEYAKNRKDEEVSRGDAEKNETEKRAPIPFSFGVMIQRFQR
jgi:hypothetical protein